jgi:hypothetical protein
MSDVYEVGFNLTFWITFVISYLCFIVGYGFLGLCLGWIGAGVIAFVVAVLWPLAAALVGLAIVLIGAMALSH